MNASRSLVLAGILTTIGCSAAESSTASDAAELTANAPEGEREGSMLTAASLAEQVIASGNEVFNFKCSADGAHAFKVRGSIHPAVPNALYGSFHLSPDEEDETFDFPTTIYLDLASSADEPLRLEESGAMNPRSTHLTIGVDEGALVTRGHLKGVPGVWRCSLVGRTTLIAPMTPIAIHATPRN